MTNKEVIDILQSLTDAWETFHPEKGSAMGNLIEAINYAISFLSESMEWVKCEDELPEDEGEYLVLTPSILQSHSYFKEFALYIKDKKSLKDPLLEPNSKPGFYRDDEMNDCYSKIDDVVYWAKNFKLPRK